jgi:hypothetical protein
MVNRPAETLIGDILFDVEVPVQVDYRSYTFLAEGSSAYAWVGRQA